MTRILSIDCAHRTLGYTLAEVNLNFFEDITRVDSLNSIYNCLNLFVVISDCNVIDVLGGKTISSLTKLERVRKIISVIKTFPPVDLVLIEDQPPKMGGKHGVSVRSGEVQDVLLTYYELLGVTVVCIPPRLKNNFILGVNPVKKSSKYEYNKELSVENMRAFCSAFGYEAVFNKLKKTTIDNATDSFCQILAYIVSVSGAKNIILNNHLK
jgi:hypothetical protein